MAESPRIARHVHAPLQSGSDKVLRRMHRKYRPRHYAERVMKARAWMPDAAIGADVMVGFPGETDSEFEESRQFIESLPFTYLHVFTYSERPGTPAAAEAGAGANAGSAKNAIACCVNWRRRRTWRSAKAWWGGRFPRSRCTKPVRH